MLVHRSLSEGGKVENEQSTIQLLSDHAKLVLDTICLSFHSRQITRTDNGANNVTSSDPTKEDCIEK